MVWTYCANGPPCSGERRRASMVFADMTATPSMMTITMAVCQYGATGLCAVGPPEVSGVVEGTGSATGENCSSMRGVLSLASGHRHLIMEGSSEYIESF